MPKSAKENFRLFILISVGIIILFVGILMLISGNDSNIYTSLAISPEIELKISTTQQLLVGGLCFLTVIVLFGNRNQHP